MCRYRFVGERQPSVFDKARVGERDALAELWRNHNAAVLRYLRARRTVSADDVASQVWIDVATSIHRFEGEADEFRRWLFTIAHRRGWTRFDGRYVTISSLCVPAMMSSQRSALT